MGKKIRVSSRQLLGLVKSAVRTAEVLFPGTGLGADKKKWVVDFLNDKIDLPILGERGEAVVFGALVDIVVSLFNDAVSSERWDD